MSGAAEPLASRAARLASALLVAFVLLFLAGIPGVPLRPLRIELALPPVPESVRDRDAALDVTVRTPEGAPVAHADVRAIALLDDGDGSGGLSRAHLAGAASTDASGHAHLDELPRAACYVLADAPGRARGATSLVLDRGARSVTITLGAEHALDVTVVREDGAPATGAEIEVAAGDPLPVGSRAGADGRAHVGRLGAGPYVVTARAPGLEEVTLHGVLEGREAKIVLRRLATVVAHVVDAAGAPAAGAKVAIAGASLWPARSTDADATGTARITSLASGSYALRATRGGDASPTEIGVEVQGGDTREVTLKLAPGRFVSVRVVAAGEDDAPIAAAKITLVESGLSPFPIEALAGADGRARLGPIVPGPATLAARADDFVARSGIAVPEDPGEVKVALPRAGAIEGRVVDARGFPVDGATLEIVGTDFDGAPIADDPRASGFRDAHFQATLAGPAPLVPAGELGVMPGPLPPIPHVPRAVVPLPQAALATLAEPWVTASDGTFHAAPVTPGRVRVLVHHPEYVEAASDGVTLRAGATAHVEIVLHAGGTLEGRVVDARGEGVAGARVTASATKGALERTTRAADDGTFAFAALPDAISLSVTTDDDLGAPRARLLVDVPEGEKRTVTITLPDPRPALAVRVKDDHGDGIDAAQVSAASLEAGSPLRTTAFTSARGACEIPDAAGIALRIEVSAPGFAPRVVTEPASATASRELEVVLARAESLAVDVRDMRGFPLEGVELVVYADATVKRARTDDRGEATLNGLAPGSARVRARKDGYATAERSVTIEESGGRHATELPRIELAAEGRVEGEVVDARGEPVQGARIARDRVPTWLAVGATPAGVAVSDARGRFALGALPEGDVTLEAYAPDAGRVRVPGVRVTAGRTTSGVRLVLASQGEAAADPGAAGGVAVTLGETDDDEVVIVAVEEGSAAERAGLVPGDVIVTIDGTKATSMAAARARLSGPIADDVVLALRRDGRAVAARVPREAVRR